MVRARLRKYKIDAVPGGMQEVELTIVVKQVDADGLPALLRMLAEYPRDITITGYRDDHHE